MLTLKHLNCMHVPDIVALKDMLKGVSDWPPG